MAAVYPVLAALSNLVFLFAAPARSGRRSATSKAAISLRVMATPLWPRSSFRLEVENAPVVRLYLRGESSSIPNFSRFRREECLRRRPSGRCPAEKLLTRNSSAVPQSGHQGSLAQPHRCARNRPRAAAARPLLPRHDVRPPTPSRLGAGGQGDAAFHAPAVRTAQHRPAITNHPPRGCSGGCAGVPEISPRPQASQRRLCQKHMVLTRFL